MTRVGGLIAALALSGCRSGSTLQGVLVDARTGLAVTHGRVSFVPVDGRCASTSVPTGADGTFAAGGLCAGETYHVTPLAPYVLPEPVEATPSEAPLRLEAWAFPVTDGVWMQRGEELTLVSSTTTVDTLPYASDVSAIELRVPVEVPSELPRVGGADALVLSGQEAVAFSIETLTQAGPRTLGAPDAPVAMGPWWYIGAKAVGESLAPVAPVVPDATHVRDVSVAGRGARYLGAPGLPPGSYALTRAASGRAILFEVGEPAPATADAD